MELRKPRPLAPGDLIGVISPASPPKPEKHDQYQNGLNYLRGLGYKVLEGKHVLDQYGYLAGTDESRAADLNEMFRNPKVKAIICSRGGYGTPRLLDLIDYEMVRKHPKILVGYSDITSLQLALYAQTGLVTFSGPMVGVEMGKGILPFTEKHFWGMVGKGSRKLLKAEAGEYVPKMYHAGTGEGRLLGGCLSLINPLIGTPYEPDFTGAILVLEDIGEDVYGIDRYLVQLRYSGILARLNGLIFGQFLDIESSEKTEPTLSLEEVLEKYTRDLNIPIIGNFPYGHQDFKYTLPFGCRVRFDADKGSVRLLESAVTDHSPSRKGK
jgi:muramoyltetrapeptide carboxypeptidase